MRKVFEKMSHNAEKVKGDPLVSPGIVCCGEKGKIFCLTSLAQMVQFDTLKFRRTSRTISVSSRGLKKVTLIVAFHFMKHRLRTIMVFKF